MNAQEEVAEYIREHDLPCRVFPETKKSDPQLVYVLCDGITPFELHELEASAQDYIIVAGGTLDNGRVFPD